MLILQVGLLGPVVAAVGGRPVTIPGSRQAAVLACLVLQSPRLVTAETLITALWDDDFPTRAEQTLQQHISTLRSALEPNRAPRAASSFLITQAAGYRLESVESDTDLFTDHSGQAASAAQTQDWSAALHASDAALALWRGPALAGIPLTRWFASHRTRLDEQRLSLQQRRLEALLGVGRYDQQISEAESLVAEHPLREGIWAQLMTGLYLAGRSADALTAYTRVRRVLDDELGLDPGEELRLLERRILQRDPSLEMLRPLTVAPNPPARDLGGPDLGSQNAGNPNPSSQNPSGPNPGGANPSSQNPSGPIQELAQTFRPGATDVWPWVQLPDGQVVVLQPGIHTIGRQPDVSIRLQDSRVSRVHAQLTHQDGQVTVTDLGSTNSTSINGRAVTTALLMDQDLISIGGVPLIFRNAL